jgi:hypothetical protein
MKMIDDQLAAPFKQLREGLLALGRIEDIFLLNLDPRQRAPLGGDEIAHPRERLLALEVRLACGEPLLPRYHAMLHRLLSARVLAHRRSI